MVATTIEQAGPSGVVGADKGRERDISQLGFTELIEAVEACKQSYIDRLKVLSAAHKEALARNTDELHQLESELQSMPQLMAAAVSSRELEVVKTLKDKLDYLPLDIAWKKQVLASAEQTHANSQLALAKELQAMVLPYNRRLGVLQAEAQAAAKVFDGFKYYASNRVSTALYQANTNIPQKLAAAQKEGNEAGSALVHRYVPGLVRHGRESLSISGGS